MVHQGFDEEAERETTGANGSRHGGKHHRWGALGDSLVGRCIFTGKLSYEAPGMVLARHCGFSDAELRVRLR
jgi:hypothetical protein